MSMPISEDELTAWWVTLTPSQQGQMHRAALQDRVTDETVDLLESTGCPGGYIDGPGPDVTWSWADRVRQFIVSR